MSSRASRALTEFLPVSSSAHLVLVPVLTGWPDQGLAFDVAVHVGSLAAVSIYFRDDFAAMLREGLRRPLEAGGHARVGRLVVVASIPVGAAGLAVDAGLSESLRDPLVIAAATIGFGLLLLAADRAGAKSRRLESIDLRDAIVIGCAQILALVPGTSRSGITMTAGLLVGLTPAASARFSFLLSAPVILMTGGYKTLQLAAGSGRLRNGPRSPRVQYSPRSAPTPASTRSCASWTGSASRLSSPTGWRSAGCCSGSSSDARRQHLQSRRADARRRPSHAFLSLLPR